MSVLGITWRSGRPQLRLVAVGGDDVALVDLHGLELAYRIPEPTLLRVCLGHVARDQRTSVEVCGNRPEEGKRRCTRCSILEAGFAASLHHAHTRDRAELDGAALEHLRQPNLLYLAAFRDGSIKVGTSTEVRHEQRLREQGAWRAMLAARADDGIAVRHLEDAVTDLLGLPQSVAIGRKISGLLHPRDDNELMRHLQTHSERVHRLLDELDDPQLEPQDEPWENPALADHRWDRVKDYGHRLDHDAHELELLAACGRIALARQLDGSDRFAVDLGQLFGVVLELGSFGRPTITVQDSLF